AAPMAASSTIRASLDSASHALFREKSAQDVARVHRDGHFGDLAKALSGKNERRGELHRIAHADGDRAINLIRSYPLVLEDFEIFECAITIQHDMERDGDIALAELVQVEIPAPLDLGAD